MSTDRPLRRAGIVGLGIVFVLGMVPALADPFTVVFYATYAVIGGVLVAKRPRNSVGWILIGIALGFLGATTTPHVDIAALQAGHGRPLELLVVWILGWSSSALFAGILALSIVFPTGRLPAGRGRPLAIGALCLVGTLIVLSATAPTIIVTVEGDAVGVPVANPLALFADSPVWSIMTPDTWIPVIVLLLIGGVVALLVRYRRATGVVRLQLRWLVAALAFVVLAVSAGLATIAITGTDLGGLVWVPAIVAYPTVPIAILVSVLRYRLLDIDRIISRTLGYALVTGGLAVVFAAMILGLQDLLAPFTQGQTIAVAASTLAVFALFQPLRRRVQAAVDHRFDRARSDAAVTIESLAGRLRTDFDLAAVSNEISRTADAAVRPTGVTLWIRDVPR